MTSAPRTPATLARVFAPLGAGLLPLLVGLGVHAQGFNLMDDGLWLLGGRTLAEGGHLYRDLFSIYGPARYVLLLPFLAAVGKSVLALAVLEAVVDGLAAGLGYLAARRLGAGRWAWLVPLATLALGPIYPRYVAAGLFAAWLAGAWPRPQGVRGSVLVGAAWGLVACFGLDMAAYGLLVLVACAVSDRARFAPADFATVCAACGVVQLLAWSPALVGGYAGTAWWDAVVYPATRFGGAMGASWWTTFADGTTLGQVFTGRFTGEELAPLFSGHGAWLATAWRGVFLAVWLLPPVAAVLAWRGHRDVPWPLVIAAAAGWSALLGRGDIDHLRLVAWLTCLAAAVLLGRVRGRLPAALAVAVLALLLVPRALEQTWLAVASDREGLVAWERDAARIRLHAQRRLELEGILDEAGWDGRGSVVAWPAQPGLVFLLGAPLGSPQATLLAGEVRDEAALAAAMAAVPPQTVILGRAAGLVASVRGTRRLAPRTWAHLRTHYALDHNLRTSDGTVRILHPVDGGPAGVAALPTDRRLPADYQYVRTGTTPPLGPGASAAQTVEVTEFDLAGVVLLVASPGPWPQEIDLTLQVVGVSEGRGSDLLGEISRRLTLDSQVEQVALEFPAVAGTRDRTVILEILGNPDGSSPFSLYWHRPDPEAGPAVDYYPAGQAFWQRQPVGGDLFFAIY